MPIDNSIQFNGHNSYKVLETVWSYPFGVEGKAYITHSFHKYASSLLSSAVRAQTRFFASDGSIVSTISHSFTVSAVWEKESITVAVPATAMLCQLAFLTSSTWWAAEPKSEEGQTATPYNTNYAGQLTFITPNGIYTGGITTSQIVVAGTLASPTEDLDERLVTINNNQINLSSTVDGVVTKTTLITSGGVYTGEIVATQITSGSISADRIAAKSISGAKLADGTVGDLQVASGLSATKVTTGKLQSADGSVYFDLNAPEIKQTATVGGKTVTVTMSPTKPFELSVGGKKHIYVTDNTGKSGAGILVKDICDVNEDGVVDQDDLNLVRSCSLTGSPTLAQYPRMDTNGDGLVNAADLTMIRRAMSIPDKIINEWENSCQLGLDGTGVYVTNPSGVTSYIHTW